MRTPTTLLLALVAAGLGAWIYLVEKPGETPIDESATLAGISADELLQIRLELPGSAPILLERQDATWRIRKPLETSADPAAVDAFVRALTTARVTRSLENTGKGEPEAAIDPAPFGLDKPTAVLELGSSKGGDKVKILIGDATPIGANAYARRGDTGPIVLTAGGLRSAVQKTLDDLREKSLLPIGDAIITAVVLKHDGETVRIERDGEQWWIREPFPARADTPAMSALLASLRSLRAQHFLDAADPAAPAFGLAPAALTIDLEIEGGAKHTLELGTEVEAPTPSAEPTAAGMDAPPPEREIHARMVGETPIVTVASTATESLRRSAEDLRDRTLLSFDASKIYLVRIERADGKGFAFKRGESGWAFEGKSPGEIDRVAADRLASDLATLRGDAVVGPAGAAAQFGLDTPAIIITITDAAGTTLGRIRTTGRGEDGQSPAIALADGGEVAFTLRDWVFERLDKTAADLEPVAADPTPAP